MLFASQTIPIQIVQFQVSYDTFVINQRDVGISNEHLNEKTFMVIIKLIKSWLHKLKYSVSST